MHPMMFQEDFHHFDHYYFIVLYSICHGGVCGGAGGGDIFCTT